MNAKRQRGFTLIELMIVLVVLAILVGIAYPSYERFVQRSRRAEGKELLTKFAGAMERFYTLNNRYVQAISGDGSLGFSDEDIRDCDGDGTADQPITFTENCYYELSIVVPDTGQSYTLTATARNQQAVDACGNLTLTSTGAKGFSGAENNGPCW